MTTASEKLKAAAPRGPAGPGLHSLSAIELAPRHRALLDAALAGSGGDPAWRRRKTREAHELLALSQVAPQGRLRVDWLDARDSLRALLHLEVPVPCRPDPANRLRVERSATLGLTYPQEAARLPLPGWSFLQVLWPTEVWHPQVGSRGQPLCLAASLPAGVRVRSLILLAYGALRLELATLQVDELDPAGVFNVDAARWWQQNLGLAPLSRTPFLARTGAGSGKGDGAS
jgi:hypothetical protein